MQRIARIPLAGSLDPRNINGTLQTKDQRFINCIPEFIANDQSKTLSVFMNKRPGLAVNATIGSGGATALMVWNGANPAAGESPLVSAFRDGVDYRLYFNSSNIATTASASSYYGQLSETTLSGASYLVTLLYQNTGVGDFLSSSAAHDTAGGSLSWSSATDADYPGNGSAIGNMVHIGGWALLMRKTGAKIQNSEINSLTSYPASGLFPCNTDPDYGMGLARSGDKILAFCKNHTEVLVNAGNASGSPLRRVGSVRIGLSDHKAIAKVGDYIAFIGTSTDTGLYGLYLFDGESFKEVSPPHISKYLSTLDLTSAFDSVFVDGFRSFGQAIFVITAKDSSDTRSTLAYCKESNWWFEWVPASNCYPCFAAGKNNTVYLASAFTTNTYKMDSRSPVYTDNGAAYSMILQFAPSDFGTGNRKNVVYYELVADNQTSGTTTLEVNDSDTGASDWRTIGSFDMTVTRKRIYRGGTFKAGRAHRLTHSAATAWRGQFLDIYGTVGAA